MLLFDQIKREIEISSRHPPTRSHSPSPRFRHGASLPTLTSAPGSNVRADERDMLSRQPVVALLIPDRGRSDARLEQHVARIVGQFEIRLDSLQLAPFEYDHL